MSAYVPIIEESAALSGFYVPQFELRIVGTDVPKPVLRDVVEVTYKDKLDEIDGCEIVVNNWDADRCTFKYIGGEGKGADPELGKVFDPCNKTVELSMGYSGKLTRLLRGSFTTLEPSFPSSGAPTLAVRMLSELHKLRRKKYDGHWPTKNTPNAQKGVRDSDIALEIGKALDKDSKAPRFPIPIRINESARSAEKYLISVTQKSEFDVDFLWRRARMNGYELAIRQEDDKDVLYFGPSEDPSQQPVYLLEWGKSLVDLKATITTANQYKSVTVRGWDRAAQKPIEEKIELDDPKLAKLNPGMHELLRTCDPKEDFVVDEPVYSKEQAHKLARDWLTNRFKGMVRITATTIGLPRLRAGSKVKIGNLGDRLNGTYFVTATTHTFNGSGYVTKLEARREDTDEMKSGALK